MEEPSNLGGGGGDGAGGDGAGGGRSAREVSSQGGESGLDDLDELWPPRPSSAAAMLAAIWVDNPATSERYTHFLDCLDLDPEIWEVRIHLDGVDNLERKIGRDDITYMNIVAMIETQGYSIRDSIYCRQSDGRVILVENNANIYELLHMFESTRVLNLTVKRRAAVVAKKQTNAGQSSGTTELGVVIKYTPQLVYDFSPAPVFSVDTEGQVFTSQASSTGNPYQCTQQSTNIQKGKENQTAVNVDDAIYAEEDDDGDGCILFDMGEADFAAMEEIRRKEDMDIAEKIEEMRRKREDPMLHCEGDTDIEDLYVSAEDNAHEVQASPEPEPEPSQLRTMQKKKKKAAKRGPGPTTRSHSAVQINESPEFIPSGDEDDCPGFLKEEEDDGFEPLSMVPPKGRKSRRKKILERKWYDDNMLQPHEQLCLKMCFTNVQQFRNALIDLHIAQSRNFSYHRNSNVRIIVQCIKEKCPFHVTASEIKGDKTFVIRKMKLKHTCETTTDSTRVSARWLAAKYESLFRSDPNTTIQAVIDSARQHFGVQVPKMMAYRAKWLAIDVVLGDHKEQYVRLRDFAQTVVDTNPGSRVIVTTFTPAPSLDNPHPGPTFHGLFFCINGAREGFLEGCRPFIGLDGCFVKLCTGAQILAATGRDGKNNMYPIAFAVVPKENTANWCWFLTQLKYALGGESGQFGHYTIMSNRQKAAPAAPEATTQVAPQPGPQPAPHPAPQPAPRQQPAPQPGPRQPAPEGAPRQPFVPPRTTAQDDREGGPAFKRTRTWGYFNCGYVHNLLQGNSLLHNLVQGNLLQKVLQGNHLSHQEQLHKMIEKEV
ncbi:hypothetical protein ACQ4PT_017230 [Festuca glaucescens]